MQQGSPKLVALVGLCLLVVLVLFMLNPPGSQEDQTQPANPADGSDMAATKTLPDDRVVIGGIERPATDVRTKSSDVSAPRPTPKKPEGPAPRVGTEVNSQVAMTYEALKTGENPQRYSSYVVPTSFDKEAYKSDPQAYAKSYAETVEPGRVFVTAQPEEGVMPLRSVGSRMHRLIQGESVRLAVAAVPNAPVTFTSFGMGQFDNSLSSITVVADQDGKATATFVASSGTKKEVRVLAASPVLSEQVTFTVSVTLPSKTAKL